MDIKMYVVSHKECETPQIEGYYKILVGAENKNKLAGFDFFDNQGDNISKKNPNYCELTALYWIWKHSEADIIGLCHYRRYFTKSFLSSNCKFFLDKTDIKKLLQKYDVIVPLRRRYVETALEAVRVAPNREDMEEMREAISKCSPEYLEDFDAYLSGNSAYLYNMMIMRKSTLDSYCEWLFPILSYIEGHHDLSKEDAYRSRLFGFLSERLIYVWILHNIPEHKVKEIRVVKTDEPNYKSLIFDIKNPLRNIYFHMRRPVKS